MGSGSFGSSVGQLVMLVERPGVVLVCPVELKRGEGRGFPLEGG